MDEETRQKINKVRKAYDEHIKKYGKWADSPDPIEKKAYEMKKKALKEEHNVLVEYYYPDDPDKKIR